MPKEFKPGCERPATKPEKTDATAQPETVRGETRHATEAPMVKIGKKAPEFTAPAFHQGRFATFDLAEFSGKWVLLCFYPGDFTFV